jgi:hypothetical protein
MIVPNNTKTSRLHNLFYISNMDKEITTERLRLRPLTVDDAEALYRIRSYELVHIQM